jgi:putative PIN family toxin of toxin-antitoxin system
MRVVVDTNLVVSRALVPRGIPAQILAAWRDELFELLVSEPILAEYQRVLGYGRLRAKHKRSDEQIAEIIEEFRAFATLVDPTRPIMAVVDDQDDDKFIECAVAGEADVIVSGDPHLLSLREYEGLPILKPAAFLALLDEGGEAGA